MASRRPRSASRSPHMPRIGLTTFVEATRWPHGLRGGHVLASLPSWRPRAGLAITADATHGPHVCDGAKHSGRTVADLRINLNTINSVAKEIRGSVKLKRIMQAILSLGNALNQGTARGSAIGFRLDSLLKLSDICARNNKMTLLHYLCKVLEEKLPEVLDFHKNLVFLEAASKLEFKILAEEMQAISKGVKNVEQELISSNNDDPPVSETFCEHLKRFLVVAEAEVRSLTSLYTAVNRNADALVQYFGEDPARCSFEQEESEHAAGRTSAAVTLLLRARCSVCHPDDLCATGAAQSPAAQICVLFLASMEKWDESNKMPPFILSDVGYLYLPHSVPSAGVLSKWVSEEATACDYRVVFFDDEAPRGLVERGFVSFIW
ncbi:hypothetical protein ZIOFF_052013 [Zingiber officinale]|uniref:FH2 domain-containing protein n=1 Tax=Zingiber officinale TaxID=94328 RepID=A0A8J5FNK1_ZINOF|nr:hypothetical protein ZIOFF_052013 [Zingiber officinale]